ncbi:hypothetical protein GD1_86 [Paraglaciecola Antarctic GD virus 1]|nr:hypothetical protein GD1_86 [Paraglaciecola Antarctic GD virus 1]
MIDAKDVYYLSTGEKTMMYTLRVQWYEQAVFEGEVVMLERDSYIQNLSIDYDKAMVKADAMGYLVTTPMFDLEEIRRGEDAAKVAFREAQEAQQEQDRIAKEDVLLSYIKDSRFPFGKFRAKKFVEADTGYVMYWLQSKPEDSVTRSLVTALAASFPKLVALLAMKSNGEYFGTPKTRYQKMKGVVTARFCFIGFYGWVTVMKVILDTGELVVYKGGGDVSLGDDVPVLGNTITFAGTVKEYSVYQGENQTMVQRIKLKSIEV